MKLAAVLEAQRQATPGMRLYALTQRRQQLVLNRIWHAAHAPGARAKAEFLTELVRVVGHDLHVKRASESSGYFTLEFPALAGARPYAPGGELVVHIGLDVVIPRLGRKGDKREAGCFVQFRLLGEGIVHRRMQIRPTSTPAQIWARVRHYFVAETVEIELAAA